MMVVTLIPVLKVAFTKSDATAAAGSGDEPSDDSGTTTPDEEQPTFSTGCFVALGVAFFSAMLLACMFFPCTARPS